jgi:hypothetical protein
MVAPSFGCGRGCAASCCARAVRAAGERTFPVIAAAGDFLAGVRHRWIRVVVLCVCAALLFFLTYLYGRSVPVS